MTVSRDSETTPLTANGNDGSPDKPSSKRPLWTAIVIVVLIAIAASFRFPTKDADKSSVADEEWTPNVNVGNYSLPITIEISSTSNDVQHLFDTGLMECFGFAFPEAQQTAMKALQRSSECPMCYWLLSMTFAPFINHPLASKTSYQKASVAAEQAVLSAAKLSPVSPKEQGLIQAIQIRFSASFENQTIGYQQYQKSLEDLHAQFPMDPDIMAFLADAIMVLHCDNQGYHFYQDDNVTPQPGISHAIQLLQRCLLVTKHPLCQHLYIHITEPSNTPDRAETTADQLASGAKPTQAQHLQHMPSHTYLRIGRYHDAIAANIQAHESDEAYLQHKALPYGPAHDTAFLIHAAQTSGEKRVAYDYADRLRAHYSHYPDQPDYPNAELGWHIWRTARLRMGDYEQVLNDSDETPREWPFAQVLDHYSKGVSLLVTTQDIDGATHRLQHLHETLPNVDESLHPVAIVANWTLASAVEYWKGNLPTALEWVQTARKEQESWAYTEPPAWHMTIAQCEGTLLRLLGRPEAAVVMFQHDLEKVPENRQSLYGLWRALTDAHANESAIASVQGRLEVASQWADEPNRPPLVCPQLGE